MLNLDGNVGGAYLVCYFYILVDKYLLGLSTQALDLAGNTRVKVGSKKKVLWHWVQEHMLRLVKRQ
jgi:hypothetical protein